jgi:AraC-like DNA-binding protein
MLALARAAGRGGEPPTVRDLADAAGLSRQHLTRRFQRAVGVPPKVFCRLTRFHRLLRAARGGRGAGWADLAATCGYADQSHMIAEFRAFTGLTPAALSASNAFHPFY